MTCLILIITSIFIVLAADDAVTLENRIYEGIEKIHALSNDPPIAMMIYGNSDFGKIALENLITEYAKKTNFDKIKTVKMVKEDFLNYIHQSTDSQILNEYLNRKVMEFKNMIKELSNDNITYYCSKLDEIKHLNIFENYEFDFEEVIPDYLSKNEKIIFAKNMNNIFLSKLNEEFSGIVIAGFDKKTKKGSYAAFEMVLNTPDNVIINNEIEEFNVQKSCIKIFAQNDVIESFFNGIDETLIIEISNKVGQYVKEVTATILNQIKENNAINDLNLEDVEETIQFLQENDLIKMELEDYIENIKIDNENDILTEIEGMPKEELINMVQSLIKITRLKRILSCEEITVGKNVNTVVLSLKHGIEKF